MNVLLIGAGSNGKSEFIPFGPAPEHEIRSNYMSTIGIDSWAVDLKDVGAIYPFQGAEVLMVVIAMALWIVWHIWQLRNEDEEIKSEMQQNGNKETIQRSIDRY